MNCGAMNNLSEPAAKPAGIVRDYLTLARFDHFSRHVCIVPGIIFVYLLRRVSPNFPIAGLIVGLITATCIGFSNYVINKSWDRDFEKHHRAIFAPQGICHSVSPSRDKNKSLWNIVSEFADIFATYVDMSSLSIFSGRLFITLL
jgi:hypothetical protein